MELPKPQLPPGTTREDIGARLRVTRIALGLKAVEVCREIGMRRAALSMNESGKTLPNAFDMIRFAERFGLSLDWIYRGDLSGIRSDLADKIRDIKAGNAPSS